MRKIIRFTVLLCLFLNIGSAWSESYIRYNQSGYSPNRIKQIIVMSDSDLRNQAWEITNAKNKVLLTGKFITSLVGKSDHTAKPYNYLIDFSEINQIGNYFVTLSTGQSQAVTIGDELYQSMLPSMLRFLRVARSGTDDTLLSGVSHLGDQFARVYRPAGDIALGQWRQDKSELTVDMLGGWYDAADYIKFTLTTAYTSYYLLRAYQESPELFTKKYSQSELIDILDEAKHGLDYLLKTHPNSNEFIIQVSTGLDHQQGYRLPENDSRDGEREALSAISPAQMGLTSAALALGARIFKMQKHTELAQQYYQKAVAIYQRARQADALIQTAFERDKTNDFYLDRTPSDNMGLAAIELYFLTQDESYLAEAKAYAEKAGNGQWAAWCCVTSSLNYQLSEHSEASKKLFEEELLGYENYDKYLGNIWGIPMIPSWAPLPGSAIAGAYSGLSYLQNSEKSTEMLWNNIDYFFGRNNWGVSFIAIPELLRPAVNVYSQIYHLTNEYPLGAVAEGPGSRQTFESLSAYFKPSLDDAYFDEFNTASQIFYDNSSNFQTMESTIVGQATAIYMLAVAEKVANVEKYIPSNSEQGVNETVELPTKNVKKNNKESKGGMMCFLVLLMVFSGLVSIKIKLF